VRCGLVDGGDGAAVLAAVTISPEPILPFDETSC
jgi:hypothetical protein